jgi:hypothetical protein
MPAWAFPVSQLQSMAKVEITAPNVNPFREPSGFTPNRPAGP